MSLVRADAIALPLADESVDLIVTSPPYFALRSYTDGGEHYDGQIGSEPTPQAFLEALWAVTAECRRVLKPSGSMFVNLGDKYAGSGTGGGPSKLQGGAANARPRGDKGSKKGSPPPKTDVPAKSLMGLPWRYAIGCIDQLDLILRAEIVWAKPNGLPESVTDRVRRSHEQWFHMVKEPRYYAAVDEVREPSAPPSTTAMRGPTTGLKTNKDRGDAGMGNFMPSPLGKLPGSVWTIPSEPLKVPDWLGVDHFAAFPQEWPRRLILGWSPPGICTACGEGRRPVVEKEYAPPRRQAFNNNEGRRIKAAESSGVRPQGFNSAGSQGMNVEATITGYACACPDTSAPTRPAVVLDPFGGTGTVAMVARALGRYPIHIDLSADYLRLARWRIYESGHAKKSTARTMQEAQGVLL